MKVLLKKPITAGLFWICFSLVAQEQIYSTVKDASFVLTAIVQKDDGGTQTVRITNKDVLASLNTAGDFNFGSDAKLLLRSVNGGLPYFIVRETVSNQVSTIDVTNYLTLVEPDDAVHSRDSQVNWGIWTYTLNGGDGTDFTFWTLTTLHTGAIPTPDAGDLLRTVNLISIGSGPGEVQGANAQFSGKISASHGRLDSSS